MLSNCNASCVLYSAGSCVKRVHVVLSGLRMRLFVIAMFMSLCVDVMVMSSARSSVLLVPVVLECQICIC